MPIITTEFHFDFPGTTSQEQMFNLHELSKAGDIDRLRMALDSFGDLLVEKVNQRDHNGMSSLHYAARYNNVDVAKILIEAEADKNAMVDATEENIGKYEKMTPLHLAAKHGHVDMIVLLLKLGTDVQRRDKHGNNALDIAIESHQRTAVISILNSEVWKSSLRNSTENVCTGDRETPMRKLIKEFPDVAKTVFDRCISIKDLEDPREKNVTFDYEFLDDGFFIEYWLERGKDESNPKTESLFDTNGRFIGKERLYTDDSHAYKANHPLMIMVSSKREMLLKHPLVTMLLWRKWKKYRTLFFINYMIYAVFLVFLTGYLVSSTPAYMKDNSVSALTTNQKYCDKLATRGCKQHMFANIGKYIVIILACYNLLGEIIEIFQTKLRSVSVEKLFALATYICAILFVIDYEECQKKTGYRYVWQWNAGTIAVLLAWTNLVLFKQVFLFGLYVVMLKKVLTTFLRFFLLFVLLIIGFAMSFFATFQDQDSFATVWKSFIKTTVMMTGEFEYGNIYTDGEVNSSFLGYLLFYVFLIVMAIVVMNLMVGLAVDNIKEIKDRAGLMRIGIEIALALDIEKFWLDMEILFRNRVPDARGQSGRELVRLQETIKLKYSKKTNAQGISGIFQRITDTGSPNLTIESIKNVMNPAPREEDEIKETQNDMRRDIKEVKKTLNNMRRDIQAVKAALADFRQITVDGRPRLAWDR